MSKGKKKEDFDLPSQPANDDLYVNEGGSFDEIGAYYPGEPQERKEEESADKAEKAASYPVLKHVAAWFEVQIAQCDSLSNIEVTEMTVNGVKYSRTVSIEAQLLAAQLLKEKLQAQYHEYKEFQEQQDA